MNSVSESPLEALQSKTANTSNLSRLNQENVSVISFESVQTTGRLLDKLDLNQEEELLLQKALDETHEKRDSYTLARQKPAICVPASGFPSLRHSAAHPASHRRIFSTGSTPIISEDAKLVSTRASAVENHVSDLRYSYVVVEENDEDDVSLANKNYNTEETDSNEKTLRNADGNISSAAASEIYSFQNPSKDDRDRRYEEPLNIERFRFKKYEPVRFNVTPPITDVMFSPYNKYDFDTPVNTPSHTPKTSVSSIILNHPITQSSSESEPSNITITQTPDKSYNPMLIFNSPSKASTPSNNDFKKGHHAKKSSFSFKNLFKSPKVSLTEEPVSPAKNYKSTSAPSTPQTLFKFPHQLELEEYKYRDKKLPQEYEKNQGYNNLAENLQKSSNKPVSQTKSDALLLKSVTEAPKQQHSYKMLLEPRPAVITSPPVGFPPSSSSTASSKSRIDEYRTVSQQSSESSQSSQNSIQPQNKIERNLSKKRLISKQRINMAIELRNKGNFKDSTVQLKEACKLGDRTAFLLYALALRYGSGTEIDMIESLNWLKGATGIKDFENKVFQLNINPYALVEPLPSSSNDAMAPALYECGIAYLKGYGVESSEWKGLKCLEYAGSLGHVDSMCLCGTLWSKSTYARKRDTRKAAKWFRLAKDHGADLIGAEWIYKKQYM